MDDILNRLGDLIRELQGTGAPALRPDVSLRNGLLLDPLDLTDLAGLIGREFGITAPPEAVRSLPSVGDLCAFIEEALQVAPGWQHAGATERVQSPVVLRQRPE